MASFNVYQAVTDRIIAQLEKGVVPWHKPWGGVIGGAFNRVSKKPYSMLNQMLLEHSGEYATFNQWKNLGGKIKKGAKSEIVVFWKIFDKEEENNGKVEIKHIPCLRYFNVFHISQVEGVEPLEQNIVEHEPTEEAETIKNAYAAREGLEIREIATNDAFYSPLGDYIQVPCRKQYQDVAEFYATLFHEMTHSTGVKNRLNRFNADAKIAKFGSADYSKEELIAELGSSMLMNHVGIENTATFQNSAAYIKSWLGVLKGDNRFIVSASSKAEKAAKYILFGKDNNEA